MRWFEILFIVLGCLAAAALVLAAVIAPSGIRVHQKHSRAEHAPSKDDGNENPEPSSSANTPLAKPEAIILTSTWVCSCGTQTTENFCPKCGKKRPDVLIPDEPEEEKESPFQEEEAPSVKEAQDEGITL